jgi:hypothetical protein
MDTQAIWTERVAGWKASGQTSRKYSEGKPFSASGLRYWSSRLRREQSHRPTPPTVRIAKVEVDGRASRPGRVLRKESITPAAEPVGEALAVEFGGVRLAIRPGFDRGTLAAVLDVLASRGGAR